MTDITVAQHNAPPRLAAQNKPVKPPRIGRKLFQAIEFIVFEGDDLQDAAAKAGLTTFQLRQAFGRAHVLAHVRQRREVLRASSSGKNILRLTQIRDAADNMPAVNAIKVLEQIGEDTPAGSMGSARTPGVIVNIIHQPVNAPLTDISAKPLISHDPVRGDD